MLRCKILHFSVEAEDEEVMRSYESMGLPTKPPEKEYFLKDGYINPYGISFITKPHIDLRKMGAFAEINYSAGDSCLVDLTIEEVAEKIENYWNQHDTRG